MLLALVAVAVATAANCLGWAHFEPTLIQGAIERQWREQPDEQPFAIESLFGGGIPTYCMMCAHEHFSF